MYSIIRAVKHKSRSSITNAAEHNLRLRTQENIDATRTHLNRVVWDSFGVGESKRSATFQEHLTEHYKGIGAKENKDSVLMLEFVATASPEFFEGLDDGQLDGWAAKQVEFMRDKFGENLRMGVLHKDEKTPHLHFFVSTEERKTRIYKNRHGSTTKEVCVLNAKRWNPEFLTALQTEYADANAGFGLRRGKRHSKAKHVPLKELYMERREAQLAIEEAAKAKAKQSRLGGMLVQIWELMHEFMDLISIDDLTPDQTKVLSRLAKQTPDQDQLAKMKEHLGGVPQTPKSPKA